MNAFEFSDSVAKSSSLNSCSWKSPIMLSNKFLAITSSPYCSTSVSPNFSFTKSSPNSWLYSSMIAPKTCASPYSVMRFSSTNSGPCSAIRLSISFSESSSFSSESSASSPSTGSAFISSAGAPGRPAFGEASIDCAVAAPGETTSPVIISPPRSVGCIPTIGTGSFPAAATDAARISAADSCSVL